MISQCQYCLNLFFYSLQRCERCVNDQISLLVGLCKHHQINMTGKDMSQEWGKTIQATCRLSADGRHQKFNIDISMCAAQNIVLCGEQSIVQVLLLRCKGNVHRFWFACSKITNISSSCTINKMRKGM